MVNAAVSADEQPERALALSYAPADARDGLAALLALDDRLRAIVLAARDPTIGLMRLTWWADALEKLDGAPSPAEPVLQALAAHVLPHGVTGAALAGMVDAWDRWLHPEPVDLNRYAHERGATLFRAAASTLKADPDRVVSLGQGWALASLVLDGREASGVGDFATELIDAALRPPMPRALRPLGALALIARFDLDGTSRPGSPRRVGRLLLHRLTGR